MLIFVSIPIIKGNFSNKTKHVNNNCHLQFFTVSNVSFWNCLLQLVVVASNLSLFKIFDWPLSSPVLSCRFLPFSVFFIIIFLFSQCLGLILTSYYHCTNSASFSCYFSLFQYWFLLTRSFVSILFLFTFLVLLS